MDPKSPILVVDDSDMIRETMKCMLNKMGFTNVVVFENGDDALQSILDSDPSQLPQVIFCDHEMPKKCGLDLLKELHEREEFEKIPFIAISSHADIELALSFKETGALSYIVKPIDKDQLKNCLDKAKKFISEAA